jgi:D-galactarolactone cycloisomerase
LGDLIGGYLIGDDPADIDGIQSLLRQAGFLGWRNFWIEPARWDIIGKTQSRPVYELLGGKARPIEAYCSTGEMHEPEKRVEEPLATRISPGRAIWDTGVQRGNHRSNYPRFIRYA